MQWRYCSLALSHWFFVVDAVYSHGVCPSVWGLRYVAVVPQEAQMEYNKPATLYCDLQGLGAQPTMEWYHNGEKIDTSLENYETNNLNHSLTIKHARE